MRWGIYIAIIGVLFSHSSIAQHSPITSQYLFNGMLINPAYTGSSDALTAGLTYRHQWAGFEGAPRTAIASVHAPLNAKRIALGMSIFEDRIGVSRETGLFTNYAYRISMDKAKLSFGLGFGMSVMQSNWSDVITQQAGDVEFMNSTRSILRPNFSGGIYYYLPKKYFVGLSVPFFLVRSYDADHETWNVQHDVRSYQPMFTAGTLHELNRDLKLKPSVLLRYEQSTKLQADLNVNLIIQDKVWIGGSYRTGDAVIGMFELLPTRQFRIGYAYDLTISDLAPYQGGTHEIMLQYEFGYRIWARDPRYF